MHSSTVYTYVSTVLQRDVSVKSLHLKVCMHNDHLHMHFQATPTRNPKQDHNCNQLPYMELRYIFKHAPEEIPLIQLPLLSFQVLHQKLPEVFVVVHDTHDERLSLVYNNNC